MTMAIAVRPDIDGSAKPQPRLAPVLGLLLAGSDYDPIFKSPENVS